MLWRLFPLLLLIALNVYFSAAFASASPPGSLDGWFFLGFSLIALFFTLGAVAIFISFMRIRPGAAPQPRTFPRVALVKTCFNEEPALLERTLLSMKTAAYPRGKLSFVLLDDSDRPGIAARLRTFCTKNGIEYHHRDSRFGSKAGAINEYLGKSECKFAAFLDADESLIGTGFILDNIGFFSDRSVAVVQTNKLAASFSMFGRAATAINAIFYNFVNPVSAQGGTGAFLGSAAIVRKSAVLAIGGFPHSLVEDVALSFKLYLAGFKALHNPKLYTQGIAPETHSAFSSQHSRYVIGMTSLLPAYLANIHRIRLSHQLPFLFQYLGLYFVSLLQLAYLVLLLHIRLSGGFSEIVMLASLAYFLQGIIAVCIFSKELSGSFRLGILMYLMNFSVSLSRLVAIPAYFLGRFDLTPTAAYKRFSKSAAFSALLALLFSLPFLYYSLPLSYFTPIGILAASLPLSQLVFLLFKK